MSNLVAHIPTAVVAGATEEGANAGGLADGKDQGETQVGMEALGVVAAARSNIKMAAPTRDGPPRAQHPGSSDQDQANATSSRGASEDGERGTQAAADKSNGTAAAEPGDAKEADGGSGDAGGSSGAARGDQLGLRGRAAFDSGFGGQGGEEGHQNQGGGGVGAGF